MNRAWQWLSVISIVLPALVFGQSAKITSVVLDVKVRSSASAAWTKARVGTALNSGAGVRTGKRSKCEIKFPDGSIVRLAAQSDLTIAKIQGKDLSMGHGKLYARVVSGTTARIQGGTGVASIKGTVLEFDAGDIETPQERRRNVLTIFEGLAELTAGGATQLVGGGSEAGADASGRPGDLQPGPSEAFADGALGGWWEGLHPGRNVFSTPASPPALGMKHDTFAGTRQVGVGAPGQFVLDNGTVIIDVQGMRTASAPAGGAAPATRMAVLPPASASAAALSVAPVPLGQPTPVERAFGKRYLLGTNVDVFALWGSERSLAGARVRPTLVWNDLYFEVGGTYYTDFAGDSDVFLSEAFVKARPRWGDVTIGRQHFLDGPVNNSNLGTLISFDTADAVRWQPVAGDMNLDLAYVHDFLPIVSADRSGWFARGETGALNGTVGLNIVQADGLGTGLSFDFSVPAVEGLVDVYGEFGFDSMKRHLETWGLYFPELYQSADLDVFVEYARRSGAHSLFSINAYHEMGRRKDWTGFFTLQKPSGDDVAVSVGAIKHFD